MKGQELYNRLLNFGNTKATTDQVIAWIDTCQKDIAAEAGKVVRATFSTVTADTEVALPTDFASVVEFLYDGKPYGKRKDIRIMPDGFIVFPETLTNDLSMLYHQIPADYTDLQTDLVPHPLLQPIMLYYLISIYYDTEGEGDPEESGLATRYMNLFYAKKNEILAKIANPDSDSPTDTVDAMPKRSRKHMSLLTTEDDLDE